jgi:hypothetical protein
MQKTLINQAQAFSLLIVCFVATPGFFYKSTKNCHKITVLILHDANFGYKAT